MIDRSLAAGLLLIVIFSGYENFVGRIDVPEEHERPPWTGTVDSSGLKLKPSAATSRRSASTCWRPS